jgi:hypothetical protein
LFFTILQIQENIKAPAKKSMSETLSREIVYTVFTDTKYSKQNSTELWSCMYSTSHRYFILCGSNKQFKAMMFLVLNSEIYLFYHLQYQILLGFEVRVEGYDQAEQVNKTPTNKL